MTVHGQKLNVVFHGMFAFVIWRDHLEILAPEEEDHVYKAGAWGQERRLREGHTYTLRGVSGVAKRPVVDGTKNLLLSRFNQIARDPSVLFFSMRMPLPVSITGMRYVKLTPGKQLFGGAAARSAAPSTLPLIQTLTYQVEDFANVRLESVPAWKPAPSNGVANLHVWAESDCWFTEAETDHPIRGFQQLTRLFPGLDLQLLYSTGAKMDSKVTVPGMEVWEQATLRERSQLLFGVPAVPTSERGAEVTNCISIVVDNPDDPGDPPPQE